MKEDTPQADRRQDETRRIGLQDQLAEKVVDAKENRTAQDQALRARFAATGEPSKAPSAVK